ncbi:probable elongator complex protein 2 [Cimex lectularius]|uniref:Elongator complex protein 2 n=1 Tax=Cimex lectularius TaxID=79782 RepID=A0A8I6REM4_CIMLE|nr:probable elongator complex protein 2 [Cimex lectularius]
MSGLCSSGDFLVNEYVSAGCNPVPGCMDWSSNGLLCYGASRSVLVYEPQVKGGRIVDTLVGHTERINCLSWVRRFDGTEETELVSGSTDKTVIVWRKTVDGFAQSSVLVGHKDSINALACGQFGEDTLVVTASADSTVLIWKRDCNSTNFQVLDTIEVKDRGFCFCASIALLPNCTTPILSLSLDEKSGKIVLYAVDTNVTNLTTLIGHDDWIRDMDFITLTNGEALLATGSQDCTIRLWKFSEHVEDKETDRLSVKPTLIEISGKKIQITLESILYGHEDRISGLQWASRQDGNELCLMSCSLDRSIIEWSPDPETGVWLEKVRLGVMGGDSLGFLGAKYGPKSDSILAYTHHSAFHKWKKKSDKWEPDVAMSGHRAGVVDIAWEREGRYLLSTSLDETTRLHAVWKKHMENVPCGRSWHEMSRPQIHGYLINAITALPNFTFVSAADEKVARVFKMPNNVLQNLNKLCEFQLEDSLLAGGDVRPTGASVPALGLSNKAVYTGEDPADKSEEQTFTPQLLTEPPTEETLVQNTLWPEVMKLYGHGNQVYALTSTNDGKLLASACKATNKKDAAIILWDTESWEKRQVLEGHNLTVTKMSFSPDDKKLVSVSRDRTWCLFEKQDEEFVLKATIPKGHHSRIIWDCSWTFDSLYFGSCSRDNLLCTWTNTGEPVGSLRHPNEQSVTTVDFAPAETFGSNKYLMACGCENGTIDLIMFTPEGNDRLVILFSFDKLHTLTVTRIRFRPKADNGDELCLASCSNDHLVRINHINLTRLKELSC